MNNIYFFKNNDEKEVEKFVGIEIYSTSKVHSIKGLYKHNFKDFVVKEIISNGKILEIKEDYESPLFLEDSKDKYTTFNLIKINKDTFEAIDNLSKSLKLSPNLIYYSGLKDKCSISVQKISIKGNFVEKLKQLKIRNLFFRCITPTRKPVKLGGNRGNNFTVIIRNIEDKKDLKENINNFFKILVKNGFPNYFGLQRFGQYRPNSHIVGRYLLEGNFEKAFYEFVTKIYPTESLELQAVRGTLKKDGDFKKAYKIFPKALNYERSMINHMISNPGDYEGSFKNIPQYLKNLLISAFQSYIFNKMISLRVKKGIPLLKPVKGDTISILDEENGHITKTKYIYGGHNGCYDKYLDKALKLNRALIVVPIVGYYSNSEEFPVMKTFFNEIIKQEGIENSIFKSEILYQFEFKGSFRAMTIKPIGLNVVKLEDDDIYSGKKKLRIEFSLPKGSYATMLLRELMK